MGKFYFKKPSNNEAIKQALPQEEETVSTALDYEEYVPYFDEDDGEYKYLPASFVNSQSDYDDYNTEKRQAEEELLSKKLFEKIENLKKDIGIERKESQKIDELNKEILYLKNQMSKMDEQNRIQAEVERFKREFLQDLGRQQQASDRPVQVKSTETASAPQSKNTSSDLSDVDIEKIAEKIRQTIKIPAQVIDEEKTKEIINKAVENSMEKLISALQSTERNIGDTVAIGGSGAGFVEQNYHELLGYIDEKIDNLKDELIARNEADFARQQQILHKFTLAAEKVEPGRIIDKDNIYADTILDHITELKGEVSEMFAVREKTSNDILALKNSLNELLTEVTSLRAEISEKPYENEELSAIKLSVVELSTEINSLRSELITDQDKDNEITKRIEELRISLAEEITSVSSGISGLNTDFADFKGGISSTIDEFKTKLTAEIAATIIDAEEFKSVIDNCTNIASDVTAIKENMAEEFVTIKDNFANEISAVIDGLNQEISVAKDSISADINSVKESFTDISLIKESLSKEVQSIKENINEDITSVKESLSNNIQNLKESISEDIAAIKNNSGAGISSEDITSIKEEFATISSDAKSDINGEIFKLKNEMSNNLFKVKEEIADSVEQSLGFIKDLPFNDVTEKIEQLKGNITDFGYITESTAATLDSIGVGMDTLLKQSEENATAQSNLLSSSTATGDQLISLDNNIAKLIDLFDEKSESDLSVTAMTQLSQRIARDLAEIVKELSSDTEANRKLSNEFAALRNTVLARLTGPDVPTELSTLYSELNKIRQTIEQASSKTASKTAVIEDKFNDNFSVLSSEVATLRAELSAISNIAGEKFTNKK